MIVTKKITRTYLVEMTDTQRELIVSAAAIIVDETMAPRGVKLSDEQLQVLSDLRESLLNG